MYIEDCRELVDEFLDVTFVLHGSGDEYVLIGTTADCVLQGPSVSLFASSLTGEDILKNMRMPKVRAFLRRLAENGVGYTDEHDSIQWMMIKSMIPQLLR